MVHADTVREIALSMMLLDEDGRLRDLDSLMLVEFVTALEDRVHITIPAGAIKPEAFQSIESIAAALSELAD